MKSVSLYELLNLPAHFLIDEECEQRQRSVFNQIKWNDAEQRQTPFIGKQRIHRHAHGKNFIQCQSGK